MTDRDLKDPMDDLVDLIDTLDTALTSGERLTAREALEMLEPAKRDAALCTEVTQCLFHGGWLRDAESWAKVAFSVIERGQAASFSTRKDLSWLRANIAWQLRDFRAAATHLRACAERVGPQKPAEALALIAEAEVKREANPNDWMTKLQVKSLAKRALDLAGDLVQVRHGAGVLLKVCADEDDVLRAVADAPELSDPEGLAYRESAAEVLKMAVSAAPWDAMNPIQHRDYLLAQRYATAIAMAARGRVPAPSPEPSRHPSPWSLLGAGAPAY